MILNSYVKMKLQNKMSYSNFNNIILQAPSVHIGGGLVLLRQILGVKKLSVKFAQLDERTKKNTDLSIGEKVYYIKPKIFSRLFAELRLWFAVKDSDTVLCFHNLPPLFPSQAKIVVLVHNPLLVGEKNPLNHTLRTKIRLAIERIWLKISRHKNIRYIVQTKSMEASLKKTLGKHIDVTIFPFAPDRIDFHEGIEPRQKFDFIYPASGEAHKNHINLLEAWRLLADEGIKPSLAITLDSKKYLNITEVLEDYIKKFDLKIVNLGHLSPHDALGLYKQASALIFPSKAESFGLPLIEAAQYGLPILAPELDYVRDIAEPRETFDPSSPRSIARAVRRFLGNAEPLSKIHSAEEFWTEVLR